MSKRTKKSRNAPGPATNNLTKPIARAEPRNHRELAQAIFAECDPVKIGRELLESANEKGASVRARIFETLADWQFGKRSESPSAQPRVRVVWDLPCPPHEPREPE